MGASLVRKPTAWKAAPAIIALSVLALIALAAAGCGGAASAKTTSGPTYTEADSGQTVTVTAGQSFTVTLRENPTTGYQWKMVVGPGLTLVSDKYTPAPRPSSGSPLVGAGGTHSWTLRATTAGTRTLTGVYARSWEARDAADFSLTVVVK